MLFAILFAALLQSVREVNALTEAECARRFEFSLCGTVIDGNPASFVLDDGTGRASFTSPDATCPKAGDLIRISGYTWVGMHAAAYLLATNVVKIGSAPVPEPKATTIAAVNRGEFDLLRVTVRGLVTDIHPDELEEKLLFLTLRDGAEEIAIPLLRDPALLRLLGAEISVTGLCRPRSLGWRLFATRCIDTTSEGIAILKPAPDDRFSVPPLGEPHRTTPQALSGLGYRHVIGTVRAVWQKNLVLIETGSGYGHHVTAQLADAGTLPDIGTRIRAVGLPETDLFSVTLTSAVWRPEPGDVPEARGPTDVSIGALLGATNKTHGLEASYHGCLIRLTGLVATATAADVATRQFPLASSDGMIMVDASGPAAGGHLPEPGSRITVTGVAILNTDPWRALTRFPSVRGFSIVLRQPSDIEILSRPPWWTPGRFMAALSLLLAILVGILIWNRILNRLVERRSREFLRERSAHENADLKLEERTRLAVELHDSLSQNLEGVACQISATRSVLAMAPDAVPGCLATAERMLDSCRTELRRCLFDLRGNALEARTLSEALHRTLDPLALKTRIEIDCPVPASKFDDAQLHAILCIIRELVTNAARHGKAERVRVTATADAEAQTLVVEDDGCGFDPRRRAGPDEGHFGLQGIRDRLHRLNGALSIDSRPKGPTVITITIPFDT